MQHRRLGKTDLKVSVIGYGAIKLPEISPQEASRCLTRALELGINFIDTHRGYGDSETKIGQALSDRREQFILATKTHARDRAGALADLETSLRELRTERVDLWQLHSVSNEEAWRSVMARDGALRAAKEARDKGLVGHIGISVHRSLDVMRQAIACGEFETIMLCYNPLDSEGVTDILPLAKERDMGVIAMKALSGGSIAYPEQARRPGLGGADALVAGALRWVLSNPHVDCVIPGMRAVHEVEENAALGSPLVPLSDAERREFLELLGRLGGRHRYEQRCLACGYCQPCPEGVNIPEILRAARIVRSYPDYLKHLGHEIYAKLDVGADACVGCEQCVEKCPAGLPVPDMLKAAHEVLSR